MALVNGHRFQTLLATASAGGTIAAVRNLAANGIDTGVVLSRPLFAAAGWSNCAMRTYSAPAENDGQRFIDRLLAIGAANPGQILLPTSDQTAWLYTEHAEVLKQYFRLYQPSLECMRTVLDKKRFSDAAERAGISVLPMWDPANLDEIRALAPELPYPVLIKPRTHVNRCNNTKGVVARRAGDLVREYEEFVESERVTVIHKQGVCKASRPVLQQFVRVGPEGITSISGFVDRTGELFVTRRSRKIFQRLGPLGVGVCFESMPPDPELSGAVRRLCRELNYHGVFEVEFLRFEGGWAAIDFNPRMFSQVGLDIHRGMPLPFLACLAAAGETVKLRDLVEQARSEDKRPTAVFFDRLTLRAILLAQTLTGRISPEDRDYWRTWMRRHRKDAVDFAAAKGDPMPGIAHAVSEICLGLKAIPRFLRATSGSSQLSFGSAK